eukprot:15999_3
MNVLPGCAPPLSCVLNPYISSKHHTAHFQKHWPYQNRDSVRLTCRLCPLFRCRCASPCHNWALHLFLLQQSTPCSEAAQAQIYPWKHPSLLEITG